MRESGGNGVSVKEHRLGQECWQFHIFDGRRSIGPATVSRGVDPKPIDFGPTPCSFDQNSS